METSREDFGIAIRSAFLKRGTQQRFSLLALVLLSVAFLFDVFKIDSFIFWISLISKIDFTFFNFSRVAVIFLLQFN